MKSAALPYLYIFGALNLFSMFGFGIVVVLLQLGPFLCPLFHGQILGYTWVWPLSFALFFFAVAWIVKKYEYVSLVSYTLGLCVWYLSGMFYFCLLG